MRRLVLACACLLAACSGSPPPATASNTVPPPTPASNSAPPPTPAPASTPALDLAQLGAPCGERSACVAPTECVRYYGIAGPRGPQFSSCEITCAGHGPCPAGAHCTTVADGPGEVCRPDRAPDHPPAVPDK